MPHPVDHTAVDQEALLLRTDDATLVTRAMRSLPDRFHHLLVLRELEGLSYRELSEVTGIPMGTVMSRLSRAREALRGAVHSELQPTRSSAGTQIREQEETRSWCKPRGTDDRTATAVDTPATQASHQCSDERRKTMKN